MSMLPKMKVCKSLIQVKVSLLLGNLSYLRKETVLSVVDKVHQQI